MDGLDRPIRLQPPAAATRPAATLPRSTVLLTTADPALRAVLQRALALEGYLVMPVADGGAALRFARAQRPAVVVLDLALPGHDAVTLAWRLRTDPHTATIPLIALARHPTAHPAALPVRLAEPLLPVQARVGSPLDLAQLYHAVAHWTAVAARRTRSPRRTQGDDHVQP